MTDTPEGQLIFKRMSTALKSYKAYSGQKAWRMMNYSSMYLATGKQEWADKARAAVEE